MSRACRCQTALVKFFALGLLLATVVAFGQDEQQTRTFIFEGKRSNDPVQLLGFGVGDRIVSSEVTFQATDDDWLHNSVMVIKNVSKKNIVGIWAFMFFPESYDGRPMVGNQLYVGHRPPAAMYSRQGEKLPDTSGPNISIPPGGTMEFPLGQQYEGFKQLFAGSKQDMSKLTICRVRFVTVYFSDGMKWSPGYFGRPDPSNLGKYIQITPSEFYEYKSAGPHSY